MNRETFITLLTKEVAGDISEKEALQLKDALQNNKEYNDIYNGITHKIQDSSFDYNLNEEFSKVWQEINNNASAQIKKQSVFNKNVLRVAAVLLVVCGIAVLFYMQNNNSGKLTAISSGDKKLDTVLADGSRILLDEHSRIKLNGNFGKNLRGVSLTGNAMFDVAHNSKIPFIVTAGNINVEVKGTLFKIRKGNEKNIEVILLRGFVQVINKKNKLDNILLRPNQKLSVAVTDSLKLAYQIKSINQNEFATGDTLEFKAIRLEKLAILLERKYNVAIEIQNDELKNKRFSGKFTNQTIKEALNALKISYPFSYTISGNTITINN